MLRAQLCGFELFSARRLNALAVKNTDMAPVLLFALAANLLRLFCFAFAF